MIDSGENGHGKGPVAWMKWPRVGIVGLVFFFFGSPAGSRFDVLHTGGLPAHSRTKTIDDDNDRDP